jgi:hypothetical protein
VCAAQITGAARVGHDVPALITRVCEQRAWEDDAHSPAQSIARVLSYRLKREITRGAFLRTGRPDQDLIRTTGGDTPRPPASAQARTPRQRPAPVNPEPMPQTPWDGRLKDLLGGRRWEQYAADPGRRDVAAQLTAAAADGHDVGALLTRAVNSRAWEDDPQSPSRRVGGVLHHRIEAVIASGEFKRAANGSGLPPSVAQAVANAAAPAGSQNDTAHQGTAAEAPPRPRHLPQRSGQQRE